MTREQLIESIKETYASPADLNAVVNHILGHMSIQIDWDLLHESFFRSKVKYQVWSEGYSATGERGDASFCGEYIASGFDQAVVMYLAEHPALISSYSCYAGPDNSKVVHRIWACRLFDNEADARKSFG